jgi:hypothetical protein
MWCSLPASLVVDGEGARASARALKGKRMRRKRKLTKKVRRTRRSRVGLSVVGTSLLPWKVRAMLLSSSPIFPRNPTDSFSQLLLPPLSFQIQLPSRPRLLSERAISPPLLPPPSPRPRSPPVQKRSPRPTCSRPRVFLPASSRPRRQSRPLHRPPPLHAPQHRPSPPAPKEM